MPPNRKPRLKKGKRYKVSFFGYDEGGLARGRGPCGYEVRARGGCREEVATVKLDHVSPHEPLAWGRIQTLHETSPHRVSPICKRSNRCGGCPWLHLSRKAQLEEKAARLQKVLEKVPAPYRRSREPLRIETVPPDVGYRNRGKYVPVQRKDHIVMGGYTPRSHRVISTLRCPVVEPAVDTTAQIVAKSLASLGADGVYNEHLRKGLLRYVSVRSNYRGETLITLVATRSDDPRLRPLATKLMERCPELVGVTLNVNPTKGNRLFGDQRLPLAGRKTLQEGFGDIRVLLGGESFAQAHRHVASELYKFVIQTAMQGESSPPRCWDLFCGTGALSFGLFAKGCSVLGVELDPTSVALAQEQKHRIVGSDGEVSTGIRFLSTDANACSPEASSLLPEPDAGILNPPRGGCEESLLDELIQLEIRRLIYISCNPKTLARDLSRLTSGGYHLTRLRGFDMMPHTPHLESVAVLERKQSPEKPDRILSK